MKSIQEYKTLLVIFPPNFGGNHLVNLISTSPYVEKTKKDIGNYRDFLVSFYEKTCKTYHLCDVLYDFFCPEKVINAVANNTLTSVIPLHIDEAYFLTPFLKPLGNIGFITFELFGVSTDFFKKSNRDHMNISFHQFMYRKEIVEKILEIPDEDGAVIPAADFLKDDISEILSLLNNSLFLDLDLQFCSKLHTIRQKKLII